MRARPCEFIEKAVKDVQGVLEANMTTGIYDLILKVQADDENKLQEVIQTVKKINGVTSTITSIIYKTDNFSDSTAAGK